MKSRSPAFQFYAADFLVGVMGMSDEEIGVYIKMLAMQWERGALPNCPKSIRFLINSRKNPSENVMKKFEVSDDGMLRNERLEKERKKQESFRESRVENAKKRWDKTCTSNARASGSICITDALHSSSSSSDLPPTPKGGLERKPKERPDNIPTSPQALRIAALFRRRPTTPWSAKEVKAYKAIGKIDPEDLELVCRYTEAERQKGENGRHRRDLATFLNNFTGELDRAREKPINGHQPPKQIQFID